MSNKDQDGFYRGTRRYVVILLAAAPLFALSRFVCDQGGTVRCIRYRTYYGRCHTTFEKLHHTTPRMLFFFSAYILERLFSHTLKSDTTPHKVEPHIFDGAPRLSHAVTTIQHVIISTQAKQPVRKPWRPENTVEGRGGGCIN